MEIVSEFEVWLFLAGLGIFLYGMHMMEESIRLLGGGAFKTIIRKFTGTRLKAMFGGMISTAILQSSSAVSLMVLAFTGAGIMNLVQAISVMMGAKIGTTATAWIVAVFGFEFNIDSFTLPMIATGGLGLILLSKSPRYVNISKFLVAFGFLFMGLDYMKSSVGQFSEMIDPEIFAGYSIVTFAAAGLVMTAIMQSSSATIAIVLTMLFNDVIGFQAGAAMVVGANVGTTVTVLLGSIGGIFIKKQAAVSQLVFTVTTAILTLILLPVFTWIVLTAFQFDQNVVLGLALFHTLFNVAGVLLFYPFIPALANTIEKWMPEKVVHLKVYIHKTDPEVSDAATEALRKEIGCQLVYTLHFIDWIFHPKKDREVVEYSDLQKYHAEIFGYYTQIHSVGVDEEMSRWLDELLRASRNSMNSAKNMQELLGEIQQLQKQTGVFHKKAFSLIKDRFDALVEQGLMLQSGIKNLDDSYVHSDILNGLFVLMEKSDQQFIMSCSEAVRGEDLPGSEITTMLMVNRAATQAGRMILFSLQTLLTSSEVLYKTRSENLS